MGKCLRNNRQVYMFIRDRRVVSKSFQLKNKIFCLYVFPLYHIMFSWVAKTDKEAAKAKLFFFFIFLIFFCDRSCLLLNTLYFHFILHDVFMSCGNRWRSSKSKFHDWTVTASFLNGRMIQWVIVNWSQFL